MESKRKLNAFNVVAGIVIAVFAGAVLAVLFHWIVGFIVGILVLLGLNLEAPWFDYGAPS